MLFNQGSPFSNEAGIHRGPGATLSESLPKSNGSWILSNKPEFTIEMWTLFKNYEELPIQSTTASTPRTTPPRARPPAPLTPALV